MAWLLFSLLGLGALSVCGVSAQAPLPRTLDELGFAYEQVAYFVPAEIVLIDYESLRRDFPSLRKLSERKIARLIQLQAGITTASQQALRNRLVTDFQLLRFPPRRVVHPLEYERAGVVKVL